MKRIKHLAIALVLAVSLVGVMGACDIVGLIGEPLLGTWTSTIGVTWDKQFKSGGTMTTTLLNVVTTGTWSKVGDQLTTTDTGGSAMVDTVVFSNWNKTMVLTPTGSTIGISYTRKE
jgi:hypothetical protein